jgi:protein-tyrosine phosphatase
MSIVTSDTFRPILVGQHNFRDLGGIKTKDNKTIKPGLLFRSGDLFSITDDDIAVMQKLRLKMIIDFRSEREFTKRPNREIPGIKEIKHLPIYDAPRELAAQYLDEGNANGIKHLLVDEYARIIVQYTDVYRQFLTILAQTPNVPLVFQCSAGKDRTGLATIFLLTALGVDPDVILKDYFLTNIYAQALAVEIIGKLNNDGYNGEIMRPMFEVRQEYIDSAILTINLHYGSLGNYVFEELHADKEVLRRRFLYDA